MAEGLAKGPPPGVYGQRMAHIIEEPHMIPGGDAPQWIKVEMWGLLPPGRSTVNVNPDELLRFADGLGFTRLVGPMASAVTGPPEPA